LGIAPPAQLKLLSVAKRADFNPTAPGSPAAAAEPKFQAGDAVVAMTDPTDPSKVTPVETYTDYQRRMVLLAGKDVTFHVMRAEGDKQPVPIVVKPAFRHDLGLRMRMEQIVAVRAGGPAERAGVIARNEGANPTRGDVIKAVLLPPDASGTRVCYANGSIDLAKPEFEVKDPKRVVQRPLDPLLLPHQLNQWAAGVSGPQAVHLEVRREENHKEVSKVFRLEFDPSYRFDREGCSLPNSPLPIGGLGLAYWVEGVVDEVASGGPAADAKTPPGELPDGLYHRVLRGLGLEGREVAPGGEARPLQPNDVIKAVRFKAQGPGGAVKAGDWNEDLKPHQWASVDSAFQAGAPEIDLKVERAGEVFTVTLKGRPHAEFPSDDRGLIFQAETQGSEGGRHRRRDRAGGAADGAVREGRVHEPVRDGVRPGEREDDERPADDRDGVLPVRGRGLLAVPLVPRDDLGEPGGGELPADPGLGRRAHGVPDPGEGAGPAGAGAAVRGGDVHRAVPDPVVDGVRHPDGRAAAVLRLVLTAFVGVL
jgi:regulator of sigma E protease